MLFLIWLMMVVGYCDRINLTVAGPEIMAGLHIGKPLFGYVLSAFTLGYASMQAPGGFLADRYGARPILVAALILWSIFTAATGMASVLVAMLVIRVLFGIGEGIENGAQFKLIGEYFTPRERSQANGLFLSALALGPAIAAPLAAYLIHSIGWSKMFFAFGAVGLVVAVVLAWGLPAPPPREPGRAPTERFWARSAVAAKIPALRLCALGYFLFNLAYWGLLGWAPTYLTQERHVRGMQQGWLLSAVYISGFLGLVVLGRMGSTSFAARRSSLVAHAYFGAALSLTEAAFSPSTFGCVVGLAAAAFFLYGSFGPIWAIALDLAPEASRGLVTGWVNFGGQVGGFISPIAIGFLAGRSHSFLGGILFMSAALLAACLVMALHAARYRADSATIDL